MNLVKLLAPAWAVFTCACLLRCWPAEQTQGAQASAERLAAQLEGELEQAIGKSQAAFVFVGGGAGVCISPDGYILTSNHVVSRQARWTVRIYGAGQLYPADVVGRDPLGDVALLKVPDARGLPWAPLADPARLRVGQWVLALGDPYKLGDLHGPPAASLGTLSALHRYQPDGRGLAAGFCADLLQADAAVNPGCSGGPLLTLNGELAGLTSLIMARFGGKVNSGIAYATPAGQLARFLPLLKTAKGGVVHHGTLPPETWAEIGGCPHLSVNGEAMLSTHQLMGTVHSYPEGAEVELAARRGAEESRLRVKLVRLQLPGR